MSRLSLSRIGVCLLLAAASFACHSVYEFDSVAVGGEDEAPATQAKSNLQFMRAVYADLLGRSPTRYDFIVKDGAGAEINRFQLDEQLFLLAAIDATGDPTPMRSVFVAGMLASEELALPAKAEVDGPSFIGERFRQLLGRDPTRYELERFQGAWDSSDQVGPAEVIRALIMSQEYQTR